MDSFTMVYEKNDDKLNGQMQSETGTYSEATEKPRRCYTGTGLGHVRVIYERTVMVRKRKVEMRLD